jgi:hypothetical protein
MVILQAHRRRLVGFLSPLAASIAVKSPAVNRLVAGSSPARGANQQKGLGEICLAPFFSPHRIRLSITACRRLAVQAVPDAMGLIVPVGVGLRFQLPRLPAA